MRICLVHKRESTVLKFDSTLLRLGCNLGRMRVPAQPGPFVLSLSLSISPAPTTAKQSTGNEQYGDPAPTPPSQATARSPAPDAFRGDDLERLGASRRYHSTAEQLDTWYAPR